MASGVHHWERLTPVMRQPPAAPSAISLPAGQPRMASAVCGGWPPGGTVVVPSPRRRRCGFSYIDATPLGNADEAFTTLAVSWQRGAANPNPQP